MIKNPKIQVDVTKSINDTDLADLCNITEQAINAGGGFGWLRVPPRKVLIKYWKGTMLVPHRKLIVGRLNKVIAGTLQLIFQPPNDEVQQNIANIKSMQRGGFKVVDEIDEYIDGIGYNSKSVKMVVKKDEADPKQCFERAFMKYSKNSF